MSLKAVYHKSKLQELKHKLGSKCTYTSCMFANGKDYLKIVVYNETGGKDTLEIEVVGGLQNAGDSFYADVLQQIQGYAS